ncbi:MAG: GNAT family N-acetyltransferase [Blautia sp.]|nr:GNAT family N-acetyltransferase [Blautia sp.]
MENKIRDKEFLKKGKKYTDQFLKDYKVKPQLSERFQFRNIRPDEGDQAADIETICFPPNEACAPERMKERTLKVPELFLVAEDRGTGRIAGLINGVASESEAFRDEFFTDISLHHPDGKNVFILGVDVLPQYRGQGLAKELMYRYLLLCREMGRNLVILTCLDSKVDMYRKMGYQDQGMSGSVWGGEQWHEMSAILADLDKMI